MTVQYKAEAEELIPVNRDFILEFLFTALHCIY